MIARTWVWRALEHLAPRRRAVIVSGGILLIDTAFKIDVGETVVVGTSRLEDTQALILLVSAVR